MMSEDGPGHQDLIDPVVEEKMSWLRGQLNQLVEPNNSQVDN